MSNSCFGDNLVVCFGDLYLGDGLVVHVWVGDSLVVCLGDVPG